MMQLVNRSRFQALALPAICHEDKNHIVVIVKGTFNIEPAEQRVSLSKQQAEILLKDEYWGEPGKFSLKYEADIALSKPGTDVILIGKAQSTRGAVRQLDVSLSAGPLQKVVRVFGSRYWEKTTTGWSMTDPEAFESLPLVYEFAYGGENPGTKEGERPEFYQANPVGKGYVSSKSPDTNERIPLPNLELPEQLISSFKNHPEPAGFGAVARNWEPRSLLMGTYDQEWEENRNPLLPQDFDPASFSAASAGLCSKEHFSGGEQVIINNASAAGQMNFTLPTDRILAICSIDSKHTEHHLVMDTVVIEPQRNKLTITWRVAIPCHWNLAMVEWVKVLEIN